MHLLIPILQTTADLDASTFAREIHQHVDALPLAGMAIDLNP
jgi:hypothetical protein